MSDNLETLNKVFEKYKLAEPIPDWAQSEFFKSRERILINILKNVSKYSLITLLISKILFKAMSWGIKLTVFQAKLVVLTSIMLTVGTITTGSYIAYKAYESTYEQIQNHTTTPAISAEYQFEPHTDINIHQKQTQQISQIPQLNISYNIGIQPLKFNKEMEQVGKNINSIIQNSLKKAAPEHITDMENNNTQKVSSLLVGSINKNDNDYTLILRLVNVNNSDVLWGNTIKFTSQNKEKACHDIIVQLIKYLNSK